MKDTDYEEKIQALEWDGLLDMKLHVLVESNTSAFLLVKVLSTESRDGAVERRASAPLSSLDASARTLLALRNEPVAVVLDAGSTDPEAASRQRQAAEEVIGETAWRAPLRILVAIPTLEALPFLRPDAVVRAFGTVPPIVLELGRFSPRDALKKLDPTGPARRPSSRSSSR